MKNIDDWRWILLSVVLAIITWELGSIHKHLHEIECRTGDYISDRDGSRWKECAP